MTNGPDMDARLQRLVASLPAHPAPGLPRQHRLPVPAPFAIGLGAIAVALLLVSVLASGSRPMLATTVIAGNRITYEEAATWGASVSQAQAEEAAIDFLASLTPSVSHLRVTGVSRIAGVRTIIDARGDTYEGSEPVNAWVVEVKGDSVEFAFARGSALIDASSGRVLGAGMLENNEPGQIRSPNARPIGSSVRLCCDVAAQQLPGPRLLTDQRQDSVATCAVKYCQSDPAHVHCSHAGQPSCIRAPVASRPTRAM